MLDEQVDYAAVINQQSTRISELEREVTNLQHQVDAYRTGRRGYWGSPEYWRIAYLEGKVHRQASAIRQIQKVGWQPTLIIREDGGVEEKHEAKRRPKKKPMYIIEGI